MKFSRFIPLLVTFLFLTVACELPDIGVGSPDGTASAVPEANNSKVYKIEKLLNSEFYKKFADSNLAEQKLQGINSIAISPSGIIYLAETNNNSILQIDQEGNLQEVLEAPDLDFSIPQRIHVADDGEVVFTSIYQNEDHLFYYFKEGGVIQASKNPLVTNGVDEGILAAFKESTGQYAVFYGEDMYQFSGDFLQNTKLAEGIVVGGNQFYGNVVTINKNGDIYFKTDDFSFTIREKIGIINKFRDVSYIKSELFLTDNSEDFNRGDGKLPNAYIGDVTALCIGPTGELFFVESIELLSSYRLRKITADNQVITLAGGKLEEITEGVGAEAGLSFISGMAITADGTILMSNKEEIIVATPN